MDRSGKIDADGTAGSETRNADGVDESHSCLPAQRQRVILVVHDSPPNLRLLSIILEGDGYATKTAANVVDALQVIKSERIDLVLSHVRMAGEDGFQLCLQIRAELGLNLPIILHTVAQITDVDRRRAEAAGATRLVAHPLKVAEFVRIVGESMDNSRADTRKL